MPTNLRKSNNLHVTDAIAQIVIDETRHILYTRSEKGSIGVRVVILEHKTKCYIKTCVINTLNI